MCPVIITFILLKLQAMRPSQFSIAVSAIKNMSYFKSKFFGSISSRCYHDTDCTHKTEKNHDKQLKSVFTFTLSDLNNLKTIENRSVDIEPVTFGIVIFPFFQNIKCLCSSLVAKGRLQNSTCLPTAHYQIKSFRQTTIARK